jgi:hypothetical protein
LTICTSNDWQQLLEDTHFIPQVDHLGSKFGSSPYYLVGSFELQPFLIQSPRQLEIVGSNSIVRNQWNYISSLKLIIQILISNVFYFFIVREKKTNLHVVVELSLSNILFSVYILLKKDTPFANWSHIRRACLERGCLYLKCLVMATLNDLWSLEALSEELAVLLYVLLFNDLLFVKWTSIYIKKCNNIIIISYLRKKIKQHLICEITQNFIIWKYAINKIINQLILFMTTI